MTFAELVHGFAGRLGIDLAIDDGSVAISADGMKIALQHHPRLNAVVVQGKVGEPPPQALEALLSEMLEANHLFRDTGGATLSREPGTGDFWLCRTFDLATAGVDAFAAEMDKFAGVLEIWRRKLSDYRPPAAETVSPPGFLV